MSTSNRTTISEPLINVRNVSHSFGSTRVIDDVSLSLSKGEFLSIVGPTGCGKSTLLYILAGLEDSQAGLVHVGGAPPRAGAPGVGYAFPRDALLPWRTAIDNVALPLQLAGVDSVKRTEMAAASLERVGLLGSKGAYRAQLSQGMRQRVALARTLVTEPEILFMDEPFAALDAQTRVLMQDELLQLLQEREATVVFVTHDLDEAITLSDSVIVLSQRPCRILKRVDIPFERPRAVEELRREGTYQEIHFELWNALRQEVAETFNKGL